MALTPKARTLNIRQHSASAKWPELYLSIYVHSPFDKLDEQLCAEMFVKAMCTKAGSPDEADLVVFTGGPDVNPIYYNEKPHPKTQFSTERDSSDIAIYMECLEKRIPMFGICRGAQFLCVMQGGKLFQDVDGHNASHSLWDKQRKKFIAQASSVHHQMVCDDTENGMEIIASVKGKSTRRAVSPSLTETGVNEDIEAFFYRETCVIGVQGHPEYHGFGEYTKWCLDLLDSLINQNPDIAYENKKARIKEQLKVQV